MASTPSNAYELAEAQCPRLRDAYDNLRRRDLRRNQALIDKSTIDPPEIAERVARSDAIQHAMSVLTEERPECAAIVEARIAGQKFKDIGSELSIPATSVSRRYRWAIERLREIRRNLGWDDCSRKGGCTTHPCCLR